MLVELLTEAGRRPGMSVLNNLLAPETNIAARSVALNLDADSRCSPIRCRYSTVCTRFREALSVLPLGVDACMPASQCPFSMIPALRHIFLKQDESQRCASEWENSSVVSVASRMGTLVAAGKKKAEIVVCSRSGDRTIDKWTHTLDD